MSKPKTQSGSVFLILIIVIVAAILSTLSFLYWQNHNKATMGNVVSHKASNKDTQALSLKEVIDGASNLLQSKYPSTVAEFEENLNTYSPPYKPSNANFYIAGINGATLTVNHNNSSEVSWQKLNELVRVDLDNFLTENGFTKNSKIYDDVNDRYSSSEIVCDFDTGSIIVTLNCANITDYESVIDTIKPFAIAYEKSDPTMKDNRLVLTPPTIHDNQGSNVQSANLMIGKYGFLGSSTALFSTQSNGDWVFNGEHQ